MSVGTTVVNGLATFGSITATISLVICIVIGFIFVIIGIVTIARNKKFGIGLLLIAIGIIFFICGFAWYYFATYNKTTGAIAGVITAVSILDGGQKKITS